MRTTATVFTAITVALAMTGSAIGSLSPTDLPGSTLPTGGVGGQAVGCHLQNDGFVYGYGKAGVPSSSGYGDGECEYAGSSEHSGEVLYTVLKVEGSRYGYTSAYGFDSTTWDYASHYVYCPEAATLLVDWTSDEPETTYLEGADCNVSLFGTATLGDINWYAYGGGYDDVKFVHTDSLADALIHLLA